MHSTPLSSCKNLPYFLGDRLSPYAIGPLTFCLSVTLVYCGQTDLRIKMKLGTQVGLGPGHIVLDGDPAPLPKRGRSPPISAHRPNGWMDQDATWYGVRPEPKRQCVRLRSMDDGSPPQKGAVPPPPIFGPCLLWPGLLDGSRCHLARR